MDKRLALALKYHDAQLPDDAWAALRELAAEPAAGLDVLRFAVALRLQAEAFEDVIGLCERINDTEAALLKAHALHRLGRLAEAEAAYRAVIAHAEPNPAAWNDLGNVLDDLGRTDEAKAAFERAIVQATHFSPAHNNLGAHLAGQGEFAAAVTSYGRALESDPNNVGAHINLGVALLEQGDIAGAEKSFDHALSLAPGNADAADNRLYARLYTVSDPRIIHAAHAAWGKSQPGVTPMTPHDPAPQRRLRVGYVSPDFRRHSVSFFAEPLLGAHDPAAVEVFCYADVLRADMVTARVKAAAHHWRDTHALSHEALRQRIIADRIDVLVDLAGHTKGNRLPAFARRAAPVQVTALGYPATTGLPSMDYRLCDMDTDPAPEADVFATETLVRLPTGLHCYAPSAAAPPVSPLPAEKNGHLTFGSFNKLAKMSAVTIAAWSDILKSIPNAKLIIKSKPLAEEATRARIGALFAAHGVDQSRLELLGWVGDDAAHLGLYHRIDVALDTFPYNGTTTTCEALWMGVPVLTVVGEGHAARVGASLASRVGLKDWVCAEPRELAARAAARTQDIGELAVLRQGLRALMSASPLCDARGYARAVEAAYRSMWRRTIGS